MIYIEKDEDVLLPKKYHVTNNICALIYDQILDFFGKEFNGELNRTKFTIDEKKHKGVRELREGKLHILDWLKLNELNDELITTLVKHVTLSIVSDFANFMYESLCCAKKGKMTVAYSLLRKPLTDELLLLEQLLNDPIDFIDRFYHIGNPVKYDPVKNNEEAKIAIIEKAISNITTYGLFNKDIIYKLRYDKSTPNGFNRISNLALHIVTSDKNYRTEDGNLNFIFSVKEDYKEYWDHYYYFVPYLLIYSLTIMDTILFKYLSEKDYSAIKTLKSFKRFIGLILWSEQNANTIKKEAHELYNKISASITIKCFRCEQSLNLSKADLELFFHKEIILCPQCFENQFKGDILIEKIKDFLN